ncbi:MULTISPECIES: phage holin family protein [unclassified Halomonas]|uniref:phage holin family protein n=1 Tax=unclassified Halomonas TaxID=2609666 RepID=UPI0021E4AF58|nr:MULTISPECIES: phage holin family protein [unclassified Halomonas]UYG00619.1 phage holin family protein [Halomonas sp. GD1P12]WNL38312.1 phage holin family protein [Halomonas sp. PAMB 3232]
METQRNSTTQGASVGSLLTTLTREVTDLVRGEAELAKAEVSEKTHQALTGIAAIAVAGAVIFAGFLVLLASAVALLNEILPPDMTPWLSAAIVGVVTAVIGLIMLNVGLNKIKAQRLAPQRTLKSLQRDKELAQEHEHNVKEALK